MPKSQEWKEVTANFFKLNAVGDSCQGVYVDKKLVNSTLPGQEGVKQTIYTLVQDDGSLVYIGGRGKQNPRVIAGIENCRFGQYIKVLYEKDTPPKQPGFRPGKAIKVMTNGEMRDSVLAEYREGRGASEAQPEPDIPFES